MNNRYKLSYFKPFPSVFGGVQEEHVVEMVKDKKELQVLIDCINEDTTISRAFYEDMASNVITHVKPLP